MNRALLAPKGALKSKLGGTQIPWQWRGHDIFAAQAGEGPMVLLIHGIYAGSSSFEFRKLFPLLARNHRVVAIDLLGSGLSDRPNIDFSADLFADLVFDAVDKFGPNPAALVASSLGAAFSIRAAARLGNRIGSLAVICPTGLAGTLDGPPNAAQIAVTNLIKSPVVGEAFYNGLASRPSLRWFLENQAYADPESVTPEIVEYYWLATHQPGGRWVPAHFVGGALNCNVAADLPLVSVPVLVAWGERAVSTSPVETAPQYVYLARKGELALFARSRLLPHEEEPDHFADRLVRFIDESNP